MVNNFLSRFESLDFPKFGFIQVPKSQVSSEEKELLKLPENVSSEDLLYALVKRGFNEKLKLNIIPKELKQQYTERLRIEYDTIKRLLFVDYILLIYSIINYCKQNKILNGFSRGSCGGSLMLYALGVTHIDPIKHNLLFERFVSESRTELKEFNGQQYILGTMLADIDIDSDQSKKHLINKFIQETFPNRSCAICTFTTFRTKLLLKEILKITESFTESEASKISDMIEVQFGKPDSIEETLKKNEDFAKWAALHQRTILLAQKLSELIKNKSIHASGILICHDQLDDCMPVELSSNKEIISSYDMNYCQTIGVKVDNLGLKNLTLIDRCCNAVGINMLDIDVNHSSIYQYLNSSDNFYGIFQAEEGLGKNVLKKVLPNSIDDVSISIALCRPGCARFVEEYSLYKLTGEKRKIDPRLNSILNPTGNIIIFQEQVMAITRVMANFTPQETNQIRKIIGKKLTDKMPAWKEKFIAGSLKNNYEKKFIDDIWQTFEDSGNYLFNLSHSCGYSYLTAVTAYLKANYLCEFYLAALQMSKEEQNPLQEISIIHKEMSTSNIKLLPPHLTKSKLDFSIEGNDIRFGLLSIKGISNKSIEKLNKFCHPYSTKFEVFEAATQHNINIGVLCALIQAGAFEGFKQSRSMVVYEAQLWNVLTPKEHKLIMGMAEQFDYDLVKTLRVILEKKDEKGKPLIKPSRFETIQKHAMPFKEIHEANSKSEGMASWFYEKKLLGYTYNKTLRDIFISKCPGLQSIAEIKELDDNSNVFLVASIPENAQYRVSKAGNRYLTFDCEDETGTLNIKFFSKRLENALLLNNDKTPAEEDIVIIKGNKKEGNCIFGETYAIQTNKIFTKFAEFKRYKKEQEETKLNKESF